jgi:hypothetical protein
METYSWVQALRQFGRNARAALEALSGIIDSLQELLTKLALFWIFLYGVWAFCQRHP